MYTVCFEEVGDVQYPNSIAVNFFDQRAHDAVDANNVQTGDVVTVFYNTKCKEIKKDSGEFIVNQISGWKIEPPRSSNTPNSDSDDLPF